MNQYAFNPLTRRLDLVSNAAQLLMQAGAQLGGQRVVCLDDQGRVIHADHTVAAHSGRICGITLGSAAMGETVIVCRFGLLEDSAWQWDLNKSRLFLSTNGTLTQSVPTTGFLCVVGYCLSATQLFVDVQPAITLG
ncbi:MAG: hypothetical protein HQL88_10765 [Magnetococcales bacterium]|nr:hypothetical protein [Magnetococcales bacterium]